MKQRISFKTYALLLRIIETPSDKRHGMPLRGGEWLCYWSLRNRNILDTFSQPRPGVEAAALAPRMLAKHVELTL